MYFAENESCKDLEGGSKNKQLAANTKPSPLNETEERPEEKQIDSFNKDVAARHNSRAEPDTMPSTETTNVLFFTGECDISKYDFQHVTYLLYFLCHAHVLRRKKYIYHTIPYYFLVHRSSQTLSDLRL